MIPGSSDFQDFLNHLTNNALQSLKHADAIARSFGSAYVGTEHLLLGLMREDKALANRFLRSHGSIESIRKEIPASTELDELLDFIATSQRGFIK